MLTNNPTQMDHYNKHAKPGQGTFTLIKERWWRIGLSKEFTDKIKAMGEPSLELISPRSMMNYWIAKASTLETAKMILNTVF